MSAVGSIRRAGDMPRIASPQLTTVLTAPSDVTGNDFGLFDCHLPPGAPGAVPHYHEGFSESFYVLTGRLAIRTGDDWTTAGPGDLVYVPRRGVHAFRPDGADATRFLLLFTPGTARERYLAEMAELALRTVPASAEEIDEVARRHDQVNIR